MSGHTDKELNEMFTHILDALDRVHATNDRLESDIRDLQRKSGETPNKPIPHHKKEDLRDIWAKNPRPRREGRKVKSPLPKTKLVSRKPLHRTTTGPSKYDDDAGNDDIGGESIALRSSEYDDIGLDGRAASRKAHRRHRTRGGKKTKKST